ncbi:class I SAM-dependent methyltransferase [Chondromyces crocatus]|uniref:Type 11 methyltransferase n=1 Tax=Chondromyces crocatus TaxID=52 RepID=A0A0K1ENF2_CHOCO|nr:class I SAM-dependent methyltransferase [Chondromyces crocatus]AKT42465.1 type 11 methyltransferase [Chondromyces crocatus]
MANETNESLAASDWAGARGEKWRAQLSGMEAMLRPVEEPLLRALDLDGPRRIADIGCGGGGTSLELLRRAPAGSIVHGFDVSPPLVDVARERALADGSGVVFHLADMSTARPPEGPYDRLVSRFGIMFFSDPPAAFANLAQWLAPGGRFAFAAWGRQADNPWMLTLRDVIAKIVDIPAPEPDAPGPFRYAEADKLLALLERAGFGELAVQDWRGTLAMGDHLPAAEAASFALAAFSFGELLAQHGDAAREQARKALTERFSEHEQQGVVRMAACVHIFTGTRLAP